MAIGQDAVRRLTIIARETGLTEVNQKLRENERISNQVAAAQTRMATATAAADQRMQSLLRQRDRLATAMAGQGGTAGMAASAGFAAAPYAVAGAGVIATILAMNAIYQRGAELLEKYKNAQRDVDRSDLTGNLESVTKLQNDSISAAQVKYASELGSRLQDANWQIEKFFKTSLDITEPALKLQAVWVGIVETVAKGTGYADTLIDKMSKLPSGFWNAAVGAVPVVGPIYNAARSTANYFAGDLPKAPTQDELIAAAFGKLGAALEVATLGREGASKNLYTFPGKFNAQGADLGEMDKRLRATDKQTEAIKRQTEARTAWDRAQDAISRSIALQEAEAKAVDLSAGAHARLRVEAQLLEAGLRSGMTEAAVKASEAWAQLGDRAAKAGEDLARARIQSEIDFDKKTLGMGLGDSEIAIARQLKQIYPDINTALASKEAADLRAIANMRELKSATDEFASSLVGGLLRGEDALGALTGAATNYIQKMASANANRYLQGGKLFGDGSLMSGQGAVGMASAGLAGYQSGNWMTGALGGAMAGASFGPAGMVVGGAAGLIGGLFGGRSQKKQQQAALLAQQQAEAAERRRQEEAAAQAADDRRFDFETRRMSIGWDTGNVAGSLASFDRNAESQRIAEQRAGGQAMIELEKTLAAERLKIIEDFAKAAAERQRTYEDRLFAATNDSSTMEGALAAFDRKATQERAQEIKAGGESIAGLEAALAAERLNIIKGFNDQAIEEQKRAGEEMLGIAKGIRDYLEGIKFGNLSTLSPSEQLAASRSTYEKQLGLAQGGDKDALAGITQAANPYLEQLRSFYGPSKIYGDIYAAITGELEALAKRAELAGGMRNGGIVAMLAGGGMVGNGIWNQDSVLARYAGGGNIALAGGEGVINAPATAALGGASAINFINQNGRAPNNDETTAAELRAMRQELKQMNGQVVMLLARIASFEEQSVANTGGTKRSVDDLRMQVMSGKVREASGGR